MNINLQHFTLDLSNNNLDSYQENFKYLGQGIKNLPNTLKHFILNLKGHNLGVYLNYEKINYMKFLGEALSKIPNNLQNLELNLSLNDLD